MSNKSVATKAFTPPLFGDFGKKAKDLYKKKFEYENQLVVSHKTADRITIETKIVAGNEVPVRGVFKSTVPVTGFGKLNGSFESEFHTVSDRESKTSYVLDSLAPGVAVKASLSSVKPEVKGETPDFPEGWATAQVDYKVDYFNSQVAVRSNCNKSLVDVAASVGYDNISVGAKATVDPASKSAPSAYEFGAQIEGKDYVAAAVTEKKRTALTLSYWQRVNAKQSVGATASFGLVKPSRTFTFGTDYTLDVDTTLRTNLKVDSAKSDSVLAVNVESRLANPNALLGVSAEYNIAPAALTAGKFGVSLTLGDF